MAGFLHRPGFTVTAGRMLLRFRFVVSVVVTGLCVVPVGGRDSRAGDPDLRQSAAQVSRIVAHRGASAERPECTLPAIRRAAGRNVPAHARGTRMLIHLMLQDFFGLAS